MTNTTLGNTMTALFRNRADAENAYQNLLNRGYTRDDMSVLMSEETRNKYHTNQSESEMGNKAAEGTGVGAAIGGTVGAIVGAIAAIGTSIVLPGLGLVVAGPIAAALAGAGAGGATGGLLGALIGSGIPEDRAREYESGVREGGIVLGVQPRSMDEANEIENIWQSNNGELVYR